MWLKVKTGVRQYVTRGPYRNHIIQVILCGYSLISREARGACQYKVTNGASFGAFQGGLLARRVCGWRGSGHEGSYLRNSKIKGGQCYYVSYCAF